MTEQVYSRGYFKNSKISNYIDYDEKNYDGLAADIIAVANLGKNSRVLDFGCATGKLLNSMHKIGLPSQQLIGYDISKWAIGHGKNLYPELEDSLSNNLDIYSHKFDCIICLDVLEHLTDSELRIVLAQFKLMNSTVVVRVPVTGLFSKGNYILEVSRKDKTHIQRMSKSQWCNLFASYGFDVTPIQMQNIYNGKGVLACRLR